MAIFGSPESYSPSECSESTTTNTVTVTDFNATVGDTAPPAFTF